MFNRKCFGELEVHKTTFMVKRYLHAALLSAFCFLTFSCSDDGGGGNYEPKTYNVSGKVEKGPFISGSTITMQPMDAKMQASGETYSATITDNAGNFTFGSKLFEAPFAELTANGYFDSIDENARYELKENLNKQRTEDFKTGTYAKAPGLPDKLTGDEPQFVKDYYGYYKTPRGFHKRSINSNGNWNTTASLALINMPILAYSDEIRNAVLVIHGEKAHSRYFSEDAFKKLKGDSKELLIVEGANHVDLYDNLEKIPFDKIENFFNTYLKEGGKK